MSSVIRGNDSFDSAITNRIQQGTAVASTSETYIDFTGIPSWAKRITVMFNGVSTSGSSLLQVQIGATTLTTSGYNGGCISSGGSTSTGGAGALITRLGGLATTISGSFNILLQSTNSYIMNGNLYRLDTADYYISGSTLTISGTLDRIRITTVNGTDTFDAGTINIMWEG